MTTCEPGASEVFTQGLLVEPARDRLLRPSRPAAISTDGFEVLVQLVMAAMHHRAVLDVGVGSGRCALARRLAPGFFGLASEGRAVAKTARDLRRAHAILRAARAGQARLDGGHVELDDLGVVGLGLAGLGEDSLLLAVGLDQANGVFARGR